MARPRTKAPVGSLSNMATKVRDQKAASKNKPVELKSAKFAKDTSSEASASSSDSDSDSGSGDSGDDVDVEAARNKYAAKQAAKQASKRKASEKEKPKSAPTKPTATNHSSKAATTSPDDSDSEGSQSSSSEDSIPTTPVKNGAKVAAQNESGPGDKSSIEEESGSESEGSSESEAEEAAAPQSNEAKSQDESSDAASEIDPDSDEEPNSSQGNAMDVDGEETAVSKVNGQSTAESSTSQPTFPRPRWLDNSNFTIRKAMSDNPAQEVTDFFNNTNLEGKQLWYFTAPASLPITILKDVQIDLTKAVTGDALLQHNGDDFGIYRESDATNTQIQLLIPSPAGDTYTPLNRGINDTVHLRRIAKFGPDGAISATATDEYTPVPKPIRQQPQNLKPRFTPIGVPTPMPPPIESLKVHPTLATETEQSEADFDSDSQAPATPTRAKGAKKSNVKNGVLKRKHPEDEGDKSTSTKAATKRAKTTKSTTTKVSSTKETPVRPPTQPSQTNGASAPATKGKAKAAKKEKKDPRSSVPPAKLTPVPVPSFPGMRR
ncbi:DNA-directed RNA polymerase I subunit RPA34.5-domain-containing protein [Hypoxylon sp. FL1150]|nr:DNA-directed RNA polymerase I subunit RPA34.5-domain-containing protein [Hypoxylon sp. FL1150]